MNPLAKLVAAFPNPEIHPATIKVYAEALKDQDQELLAWAVDAEIASSPHFPRVAALLERIRQRKVALVAERQAQEQKRLLAEPTNQAPPKLMDLLNRERERGGRPRRLFGNPDDAA